MSFLGVLGWFGFSAEGVVHCKCFLGFFFKLGPLRGASCNKKHTVSVHVSIVQAMIALVNAKKRWAALTYLCIHIGYTATNNIRRRRDANQDA